MAIYSVKNVGEFGDMSDVDPLIAPPNSWTHAQGVRFHNNLVLSMPGHFMTAYGTPAIPPLHLCPVLHAGVSNYMIYAGSAKIYCGHRNNVQTNLTRQTAGVDVDYTADRGKWTSTLLSGIPVLNNGTDPPQSWDLNLANNFTALANWPASTTAKSVRAYKSYLIAMGISKGATYYPHLIKWSHPADPGAVPSSWDQTNPAVDAGEYDVGDSWDSIVDGLPLRDSFFIYKKNSVWRMDAINGPWIFRFSKVYNDFGALTRNCVLEHNGQHIVVTGSDIVIHDGSSQPRSLLDNRKRTKWIAQLSRVYFDHVCIVKNVLHNEAWIIYPHTNLALNNTEIIRINLSNFAVSHSYMYGGVHGAVAHIDNISNPWSSTWTKDNIAINAPRLALANAYDSTIRIADGGDVVDTTTADMSASFYRRGLDLGLRNRRKLITAIRPKIIGTAGGTVEITVNSMALHDDPYGTFVVSQTFNYIIGTTFECPFLIEGRYFSVGFLNSANPQWALESYDIIYEDVGEW